MSVPFSLRCAKCETKLTIKKASLIGKKAPCPKCKTTLLIQPPAPKKAVEKPVEETADGDMGFKPLDDDVGFKDSPAKAQPKKPVETVSAAAADSVLPEAPSDAPKAEAKPKATAKPEAAAKPKAAAPAPAAPKKKKKAPKKPTPPPEDDDDDFFDDFEDAASGGINDLEDDFDDDDDEEEEVAAAPTRKKGKAAGGKTKAAGKKKGNSARVPIIASAVLGLGLIGGLTWFLWPEGGGDSTASTTTTPAPMPGAPTADAAGGNANADADNASDSGADGSGDVVINDNANAAGNTPNGNATGDDAPGDDSVAAGSMGGQPDTSTGVADNNAAKVPAEEEPNPFAAFSAVGSPSGGGGAASFDVAHLPVASEVFVRIDFESIHDSEPIQYLLKNPLISGNLSKVKETIGLELNELKSFTVGIPDVQDIAAQMQPMIAMGMAGGMGQGGGPAGGMPPGMAPPGDGMDGQMDGQPGQMPPGGPGQMPPGMAQPDALVVMRTKVPFTSAQLIELDGAHDETSHSGQQYLRKKENGVMTGVWFVDETTIVTGPEKLVTASIDQGSALPAANLSFVDASTNVLIVFAPENPDEIFRSNPDATAQVPPPVKPTVDNLMNETNAISIGINLDTDLGLVASINCKSQKGAETMRTQLQSLMPMAQALLEQQAKQAPAMAAGYFAMGRSLLGSMQLTQTGRNFKMAGQSTNAGKTLATQASFMIPVMLPAVTQARSAARRMQSQNNLRQLSLGMMSYHDIHSHFPDLASLNSESGKQLLSWRVHVLPFVDEVELYEQFKLDEPWNSPHNKALIPKMPEAFKSPTGDLEAGHTSYLAISGPGTVFENGKGKSLREITDGASNTLLLVEADADKAVVWTRPADFTMNPDSPTDGLTATYEGGFQGASCDGGVTFIAVQGAAAKSKFTCAAAD